MKKTNHFMDLNRETAMRLWSKFYGKETKVKDFTGREIAKGAYNDRNSEFGWNVDHILPQSKGGKTADYNLICCHITTNDEKADKFPCFTANGKRFEIVKVENHYEIQAVSKAKKPVKEEDTDKVNFYDSASGIKFFKGLKGIQNQSRFVGTVYIRLNGVSNTAVIDFIENFFDEENIAYSMKSNYSGSETTVTARNYNMPQKDDISKLLDKCVLLNTYLGHYFLPQGYVKGFDIFYRVDAFREKSRMYVDSQKIGINSALVSDGFVPHYAKYLSSVYDTFHNSLFVNELVAINTEAGARIEKDIPSNQIYAEYNYVFTNVSKNLDKEDEGK